MAVKRIDNWWLRLSGSGGTISYPLTATLTVQYKNADTLDDKPSVLVIEDTIPNGSVDMDTIFSAAKALVVAALQSQDGGPHTTEDGSIVP